MESVFVAHLSGCFEGAIKVAADDPFWIIPLNTEYHLDTVISKDIRGPGPHASSQDHSRTLLAQPHREYPATVLRRGAQQAVTDGAAVLVNGVEGERLRAAKMFTKLIVVYWDRDLHVINSFV